MPSNVTQARSVRWYFSIQSLSSTRRSDQGAVTGDRTLTVVRPNATVLPREGGKNPGQQYPRQNPGMPPRTANRLRLIRLLDVHPGPPFDGGDQDCGVDATAPAFGI